MSKSIYKYREFVFIFLLILLAAFLRFYQLGAVPAGLANDEANAGYDAYSLLLTGRDQWGTFLPFTNFKGFGDYPPPMYTYFSIIPVYLFGLSQFSVRVISALAGVLSVLFLYLIGKKLFNVRVGIFSALLLGIMPWSVGLSRVAISANLAILFILIAIWLSFNNSEKNKIKNVCFSTVFLGLSIYTYSAYSLFVPVVLLAALIQNFKTEIKKMVLPVIIFLIIISPTFIGRSSATVRFSQVGLFNNVTSIGLISTLNDMRGDCLKTYSLPICKSVNNKPSLFLVTFVKNYLSHFSFDFIYLNGTSTQYSILPSRGLGYLFGAFLLLTGIFKLVSFKNKKGWVILSLFFIAPIADSLTGPGNFTRASVMIPFIALVEGIGLYSVFDLLSKSRKKIILRLISVFVSIVVVYSLSSFFINYLTYFRDHYSSYSQVGYQELMTDLKNKQKDYDRIYVSRFQNDTKQYIYYLFYNKYDPRKYFSKIDSTLDSNGWYSINKIENIYFKENLSDLPIYPETLKGKILFVSGPLGFPKAIIPDKVIKDRLGNVVFAEVSYNKLVEYNKQLILSGKNEERAH